MILIKTPLQINCIRQSSRLAAETLNHVASYIKPGIDTQALNDIAHKYIIDHNAIPAPLNYGGFPKSICTSVNNIVCHGIPSKKQVLKNGDIINIDITTILNGYYGDVSATYPVGQISQEAQDLINRARQALNLSISALKPGVSLNSAVGHVIEPFVNKYGYSVVRELGGHGVGVKFHEDPFVYHFDTGEDKPILKAGMIFTVEPMVNASPNWKVTLDRQDGWTVRTANGALSAQFEHTILITNSGHEVLTQL